MTRRNDRRLFTSTRESVRNRDRWTVTAHLHRWRARRVPRRRTRDHDPVRRVRAGARPTGIRGDRARPPGRHGRRRVRGRHPRHHPPRPVRGSDSRTRPEPLPRRKRRAPTLPRPGTSSHMSSLATVPTSRPWPTVANSASDVPAAQRPRAVIPDWFEPVVGRLVARRDELQQFLADSGNMPSPSRPRSRRRSNPTWPPPVPHGSPTPPRSTTWREQLRENLHPAWWAAGPRRPGGRRRPPPGSPGTAIAEAGHAVDHAEAKIRSDASPLADQRSVASTRSPCAPRDLRGRR